MLNININAVFLHMAIFHRHYTRASSHERQQPGSRWVAFQAPTSIWEGILQAKLEAFWEAAAVACYGPGAGLAMPLG